MTPAEGLYDEPAGPAFAGREYLTLNENCAVGYDGGRVVFVLAEEGLSLLARIRSGIPVLPGLRARRGRLVARRLGGKMPC